MRLVSAIKNGSIQGFPDFIDKFPRRTFDKTFSRRKNQVHAETETTPKHNNFFQTVCF